MGTIPNKEAVAELRDRDNWSFVKIAEKFNVSRQAAHKAYVSWCKENGVNWRTRKIAAKPTAISE
jgi:hypothetical protein